MVRAISTGHGCGPPQSDQEGLCAPDPQMENENKKEKETQEGFHHFRSSLVYSCRENYFPLCLSSSVRCIQRMEGIPYYSTGRKNSEMEERKCFRVPWHCASVQMLVQLASIPRARPSRKESGFTTAAYETTFNHRGYQNGRDRHQISYRRGSQSPFVLSSASPSCSGRIALERRQVRPRTHYRMHVFRLFWDELRTAGREQVWHEDISVKQQQNRMKGMLRTWKAVVIRRMRVRIGLGKLHDTWVRHLARVSLITWPGRASFAKGEAMRRRLEEKGRARIVLVDNDDADRRRKDEEKRRKKKKKSAKHVNIQFRRNTYPTTCAASQIIYSMDDPRQLQTCLHYYGQ